MSKDNLQENKKEIIRIAEKLYQEALDANAYYKIMTQYEDAKKDYLDELNLSPSFYRMCFQALSSSCFMNLARIYEKGNENAGLATLLSMCEDNKELFPEYQEYELNDQDGGKHKIKRAYTHQFTGREEKVFEDKGKLDSERAILQVLSKLFDTSYSTETPVELELTFSKTLNLYRRELCSYNDLFDRIRILRNKKFAHNDKEQILGRSTDGEAIVYYSELKELIDFALSCTEFVIAILTGVKKPEEYFNIGDWMTTLQYAKNGLEAVRKQDDSIKKSGQGPYKVVTLCGSTRFKEQFLEAQKRLTLEGCIVISVGLFGHAGDAEVWENMDEGTLTQTKAMLDDMHKRKIDMADEIYVLNVGGHIGDSTRSEIEYAQRTGKPVRYLEEE